MANNSFDFDKLAIETALAPIAERLKLINNLTSLAIKSGVFPATIGHFYRGLATHQLPPMTIPALNLRGMTYDIARVVWRVVISQNAGPVIFELASSESEIGDQSFEEYAAMVLAAAAREGWRGPVFLQGDHIAVESLEAVSEIKIFCRRLINAGFYQIDIDASHIPPPQDANLVAFHQENAFATAEITEFIRSIEDPDNPITLGAEVGEIGKRNTSPKDIESFMSAYMARLPIGIVPFDKISVQTGTRHGGYVLVDGSTGEMPLDLLLITELGRMVRDNYAITGLVQHGASTLSFENLASLVERGVIEVHLATGIQNIIFDHPAFPADLRSEMIASLVIPFKTPEGDEQHKRIEMLSDAQQFYNARWVAWGTYKHQLWSLPEEIKTEINITLESWFENLFKSLKIDNRQQFLRQYYPER
jgi:fructose/tagatose bisphosphate aldolase